jgi:hydrophobic/amphiphilic exporter-1 (mainly G- bacteria), HAE1 family
MNLSSLSVRRGVTFGMAFMMIVGFGFYSLSQLRLDLYPDISFPKVIIITNYTGASPEDIETLITRPIEGTVASVKDVDEVLSTSKQGVSLVEVNFDWHKDMEQAETDVRRSLEMVKGFLPDDADDPIVFAFDPAMQPIIMLMLSGPYQLDELRQIAEDEVAPLLARIPGVASAMAIGGLEREIHVVLDPVRVQAHGLDVARIIGAVYAENTQTPGGSMQQGALDFTIQMQGKYRSVAEIGEVVVGAVVDERGAHPVQLKDVARVEDSFYESQRILEVDGEPAVWLLLRKQSGANTVRAADAIMDALPRIKRAAAAEIEFKQIFNQADFIHESLGNLSSTGMIGVGITFLVLLFFLRNIRSAVIVSTAIPISVIATFAVMDQASMTLNVLSMAGLALSIGMLVDNAIVVLENIFRLREEGHDAWDAAVEGARTVSTAVSASTLTTVSVFVPILFVPGIAGVMFKDMAVTICFSLAVSLFVAVTFIPLAASRLLSSERARRLLQRASGRTGFGRAREGYGRVLDWLLGHRWIVFLGLIGLIAGTVVAARLLPTEFVKADDQSMVFIQVEAPIGSNLQETYGVMREVVARLDKVVKPEERRLLGLDAGIGKGFVAIFAKGVHAGVIRIPLVPQAQRQRSQQELEALVREHLRDIPGVKITVAMPFNMMGGEGDIEIQLRGHDLEASRRLGLDLREALMAFPEVANVNFSMEDQKPEVRVLPDRTKLAQLGIPTVSVTRALSAFFMGTMAGRYSEGGDEYDIVVRYDKRARQDVSELRRMPVVSPSGQVVRLDHVADVEIGLGPVSVTRKDQERYTKLMVYLRDAWRGEDGQELRKDLGGAIARVTARLDQEKAGDGWPAGFSYFIGGAAEDFQTSFKYLGLALLISVLLVYMVMASQFESLRQPFIIIFSVPLAGIGVVLMFTLTRSSMDISSLVGVIMLVGIVVNNGIVMVDAANQLRLKGLGRLEAIQQAARIRLRPVLMTSFTTMLAMLPMALEIGEGSAGWGGMAKAVIGGLLVSTLLTLVVVPTMYTLFARKVVRHAEKLVADEGGAA